MLTGAMLEYDFQNFRFDEDGFKYSVVHDYNDGLIFYLAH